LENNPPHHLGILHLHKQIVIVKLLVSEFGIHAFKFLEIHVTQRGNHQVGLSFLRAGNFIDSNF
jgi:hypothetical protein